MKKSVTTMLIGYARITFSFSVVLIAIGCGGGGQSGNVSSGETVSITEQPASQTVPIGRTATFTVTAISTQPITYQWRQNGVDIPGATSSSYTTPMIALGSDGSASIGSFEVTVKNAAGSSVSNPATLTAGPRAPAIGDLRYLLPQQVTVSGLGNYGEKDRNITAGDDSLSISEPNVVGSPLVLGSSVDCNSTICSWGFTVDLLPPAQTGLSMYYQAGSYSSFMSDFESTAQSNTVITSLDFEPANQAYAMSSVQTTQAGGFDSRLEVVAPGA